MFKRIGMYLLTGIIVYGMTATIISLRLWHLAKHDLDLFWMLLNIITNRPDSKVILEVLATSKKERHEFFTNAVRNIVLWPKTIYLILSRYPFAKQYALERKWG